MAVAHLAGHEQGCHADELVVDDGHGLDGAVAVEVVDRQPDRLGVQPKVHSDLAHISAQAKRMRENKRSEGRGRGAGGTRTSTSQSMRSRRIHVVIGVAPESSRSA